MKISHEPLEQAWRRVEAERPGISQKELAFLWGKTEGAISQYLRGHTALNLQAQLWFARYLRLPVTAIWHDFEFRDMCPGALPPEAARVAADWAAIADPAQRESFAALLRAAATRR